MTTRFDILGIGNAIVDVVASADDTFLSRHDMRKGSMTLIDADAADALYAAMPPGQESSGGSAANTCAVAAALGSRVAYLGKVADDQLGTVFRHDMTAIGVHFPSTPLHRRRLHRALPDRGHTGRTAHDAHLSRRLRQLRRDRCGRDPGGGCGRDLPRGLPVRSARRAARVPSRRGCRACGRTAGCAVPVGRVLRRSPPRGVPRIW